MLIDWFTVGAQALNFAILAWLMKHFLYKPILDAIDAREKHIASELGAAARNKSEAQHERDAFQKKNEDLDQQRAVLLHKANADASAERQTLMDAARRDSDALAAKRQAALAHEAQALVQALRQRAQTEVFAIARQTLADLADASLEASACTAFIARLRELKGAPRDALAAALSVAREDVIVRSAFALPSAQRQTLQQALADTFGVTLALRFEVEPTLVAGIELMAQGQKFAWTLSAHLASLEQGVNEVLKARAVEA